MNPQANPGNNFMKKQFTRQRTASFPSVNIFALPTFTDKPGPAVWLNESKGTPEFYKA
jgi:hypothetical protein